MKKHLITPVDERLLLTVLRYHYITLEQITRLSYSDGARKYVNDRLKQLTDEKYLARIDRASVTFPHVYMLGIRGVRYLRENGILTTTFHPSEKKALSTFFLNHHLAINDFMIAVETLPVKNPQSIMLHTVKQDIDLAGKHLKACPDLWAQLTISKERVSWWVEIDRGTEDEKERFQEKIKRIVEAVGTQAKATFGSEPTAILFVTISGETRLKTMFHWSQLALRDLQQKGRAFRFTALPPGAVDLQTTFLEPIWYQPFEQGTKPLLYL